MTPSKAGYLVEELNPIRVLPGGIRVYDTSSFPPTAPIMALTDFPKVPSVILVDRFSWNEAARLGPTTILACHGASHQGKWVVKHEPSLAIENIVANIYQAGIFPDVIAVCNPGAHPLTGPAQPQIYPLDFVNGNFIRWEGGVFTSDLASSRYMIQGEERIERGLRMNLARSITEGYVRGEKIR